MLLSGKEGIEFRYLNAKQKNKTKENKKLAFEFEMTFGEVFSEFLSLMIPFDFMLCPRFVKSF